MSYVAIWNIRPLWCYLWRAYGRSHTLALCHFPGRPANHGRPLMDGMGTLPATLSTVHIAPLL